MGQRKNVKLSDIAQALNVSIVTVSNALKGKKGVGEELRSEIMKKAQELGYQMPERVIQKEYESYQIGVVIAERYVKEFPSFYMDIYKRVAQEATKKGCLTVLEVVSEEKERILQNFSVFSGIPLRGGIIIGEMNPEYVKKMKSESKYPIVCVDYYGISNDMDYIVTDSYRGMQLVTQILVDAGHKEIGFVGTPSATNSIMDRYMGYCKVLQKNHLKEHPEWVIYDRRGDGYGYHLDFELPQNLPTAFAFNCDKTAAILIDKLAQRGLKVPEDISVVGFDNGGFKKNEAIQITTYESDQRAMAQISINTLLKRIQGKEGPQGVRFVEGTIIPGNTVKIME